MVMRMFEKRLIARRRVLADDRFLKNARKFVGRKSGKCRVGALDQYATLKVGLSSGRVLR
jgi:hypothetical protein